MARSYSTPGIRFVAEPPRPRETLPRMDVAGFVGFAAAGPLNVPVPIEDEARLREVFGPDLPLAWDPEAGQSARAHLAPSVRSFFRNGGRRCWIVRVAGDNALSQRLPVPGLAILDTSGDAATALVQARSPGSWGDLLQVGAALRREPLEAVSGAGGEIRLRVPPGGPLRKGDLIQAEFPSTGVVGFLPLASVSGLDVDGLFCAGLGDGIWLEELDHAIWLDSVVLPLVNGGSGETDVFDLTDFSSPPSEPGWSFSIRPADEFAEPQPGMVLVATSTTEKQVLLAVDEVTETDDGSGSPPMRTLRLSGLRAWRQVSGSEPEPASAERLNRVSLTLEVQRDTEEYWSLEGLGLNDNHSRPFWRLPTDAKLYPLPDADIPRRVDRDVAALFDAVDHPRFPVAGLDSPRLALPLAVLSPTHGGFRGTPLGDTDARTVLQRDGLDHFGAEYFLDPHIGGRTYSALPAEAYHWRYQQRAPLLGLHSLYFVSEITMLMLPDALHSGWEPDPIADARPLPLVSPQLGDPAASADGNGASLSWIAPEPTDGYQFQQADDPTFADGVDTSDTDLTTIGVSYQGRCPATRWFRVRRLLKGERSPWSNTVAIDLPAAGFLPVERSVPEAPELFPIDRQAGSRFQVQWALVNGATQYELVAASAPGFEDGRTLYLGPDTLFVVLRPVTQVLYLRVRVVYASGPGPWSETGTLVPPPLDAWRMRSLDEAGLFRIRTLHRAQLEMAAARRDMLCVIAMPKGHREREILAYRAALLDEFPAQHPAPDFAALYHPWLTLSEADGTSVLIPPDGAAAGVVAARTIARGAWIAPANEPLSGVLGLMPNLDDRVWAEAFAEQINLVRSTARGILLLSAETLSRERDKVPINVRRLMILLRRLALHEGNSLVFEPNNASFRRRIQRRFESFMEFLFERGAFAGSSADQAYRVVTDETVNDRRSIDRGRFIVELRVAPSRPLTFLTVRLVQSGSGGLQVEVG